MPSPEIFGPHLSPFFCLDQSYRPSPDSVGTEGVLKKQEWSFGDQSEQKTVSLCRARNAGAEDTVLRMADRWEEGWEPYGCQGPSFRLRTKGKRCFFRLGWGVKFEFQLPYWGRGETPAKRRGPHEVSESRTYSPTEHQGAFAHVHGHCPWGPVCLSQGPESWGGEGSTCSACYGRRPAVTDCDLQSFRFLSFSKYISP